MLQLRLQARAAFPEVAMPDGCERLPEEVGELQRVVAQKLEGTFLARVQEAETQSVRDHARANLADERRALFLWLEDVLDEQLRHENDLGAREPRANAELRLRGSVHDHAVLVAAEPTEEGAGQCCGRTGRELTGRGQRDRTPIPV